MCAFVTIEFTNPNIIPVYIVHFCKYICKQLYNDSENSRFPIISVTFAQILNSHDS